MTERLRFLQFSEDDRAALHAFLPTLHEGLPTMISAFYDHLCQFPVLAAMFESKAVMEQKGAAQARHWEAMFAARFDQDYLTSVTRIGQTHSRIGLEPRYYIGAYGFALSHLHALALQHPARRLSVISPKPAPLITAINKVVILDIDLVITVYLEQNRITYQERLAGLAGTFERELSPIIAELAAQAQTMRRAADTMTTVAHDASEQAAAVAAGAEEASMNVQAVASATEELHASVEEISRQVAQSNEITTGAVKAAENTNASVHELGAAAQKIGDVVSLISNIAAQTNLLALNATIEAARAGDAGKGFAVVASEVKDLASQTAKATESITAQVTAMQAATQTAIKAIEGIVATIGTINQIAGTIAAAVEQQGAATQEIARNVQEVASATQLVSANIGGVGTAASTSDTTARQVLDTAVRLGEQAGDLRTHVDEFLGKLRVAA
ncbi:globin-coupled sensor protein [Rhodopila sp.]|uniref:globin-coupled sensor protein n=1 Tax=Rhodopila sp. TaxID=2480087 RepID=UPI002CFF9972|nr:globin-coupled sensor protein [Rhodopila sp.]HVZ07330.1 globin-coupled sensor protein [Rhodopila sp.]